MSKRTILSETEKTDLRNQIETLKFNNEDLTRKQNELHAELQRRVTLQEHINQISELKRKLEDSEVYHKHELDGLTNSLKNIQVDRKELSLKYARLASEKKKLYAENKVLDKALK